MKIVTTEFPGLLIVEPQVFNDDRGYFFEIYNQQNYLQNGVAYEFVQDNESKSCKNVVRGLHYQLAPYAQTKLVRVVEGRIFDFAVDIRKGSPTYGQYFKIELSSDNKLQLLVPQGFAHGFSVLSDVAIINYKCDNLYNKEAERGIIYNDPELQIDWGVDLKHSIISAKDMVYPTLAQAEKNFYYGQQQ